MVRSWQSAHGWWILRRKQICAGKSKLDYYPCKMAGRLITGGSAAHRNRSTRTSWVLRFFPLCAASLWLFALSQRFKHKSRLHIRVRSAISLRPSRTLGLHQ